MCLHFKKFNYERNYYETNKERDKASKYTAIILIISLNKS